MKRTSVVAGEEGSRAGSPLALVKGSLLPEEPGWLTELRLLAQDRVEGMAWPTPQEEEWRRTDLTEVDFGRFRLLRPADSAAVGSGIAAAQPGKPASGLAGTARFSGGLCVELSLSPELERRGVRLRTLAALGAEAEGQQPNGQVFRRSLEEGLQELDNRFQAWHYSSLSHGVFLYVPPFVEVKEPFSFELVEEGDEMVSAPHVTVVLDRGARTTVLLRTAGARPAVGAAGLGGQWRSLVNLGADLMVGEAAALEFYHLQDLPTDLLTIAHARARVGRDAHLLSFEAALGSGLLKSRLECSLDGPGSEAYLNGMYLSRDRQHMDIRTVQRHRAPSATSRAFYKGALKDRSRAVYQGLIEVTPVAAKTDAFLTDRNLILNDGARADSIPSLRIDTNDVKCSHGSTTGKIDEAQVFYLMSRGLPRPEAERMLIMGYFEELLAPAPAPLAEELRALVRQRTGDRGVAGEGRSPKGPNARG